MNLKKLATSCLIILIAASNVTTAYAEAGADTTIKQSSEITQTVKQNVVEKIAGLEFTGPTINLSLNQALSIATTSGASINAAEVKKQSDSANAKVNSESVSNMNKANKDKDSSISYSKSELDKARKANEYYASMADRNYEAAKNTIKYNVNKAYYSLLNAEEGVKIAKENEQLQNNLLALVNQKLSLGVASKQDVLEAEINFNNAKSKLDAAEVTLAEKKISFNIELGYDEMQDINLISKLEMLEISNLPVDQAVTNAITNRNELYTYAFNIYSAEKELDYYKDYPISSAKYLTAYSNLNSAQNSYNNKEASIKKEVMINYANLMSAKNSAENSKLSVEKAKEPYDIYLAKYKLGLATLDNVQEAQINYSDAKKAYSEAILAFNLAVINYEMSATVGMASN